MIKYLYEKGYLDVEKIIFQNFNKIGLTEKEMIVLINLIELKKEDKNRLKLDELIKKTNYNKEILEDILNQLIKKDFISMDIEITKTKKQREIFIITPTLEKVSNLINSDIKNDYKCDISKVVDLFEKEFNRNITPMESDIIKNWDNRGYSYDQIYEALQKAVKLGVKSFNYVDKILSDNDKKTVIDEKDSKLLGEFIEFIK